MGEAKIISSETGKTLHKFPEILKFQTKESKFHLKIIFTTSNKDSTST